MTFNYTVATGAANQAFNLTIPDICEASTGTNNGKQLLLSSFRYVATTDQNTRCSYCCSCMRTACSIVCACRLAWALENSLPLHETYMHCTAVGLSLCRLVSACAAQLALTVAPSQRMPLPQASGSDATPSWSCLAARPSEVPAYTLLTLLCWDLRHMCAALQCLLALLLS